MNVMAISFVPDALMSCAAARADLGELHRGIDLTATHVFGRRGLLQQHAILYRGEGPELRMGLPVAQAEQSSISAVNAPKRVQPSVCVRQQSPSGHDCARRQSTGVRVLFFMMVLP